MSFLAKHVQEALQPEGMDGDINSSGASVSTTAIECAILHVCERVNYGIDWMERTSAATSIWRWELKEQFYNMLPKASREKFESSLADRRQVRLAHLHIGGHTLHDCNRRSMILRHYLMSFRSRRRKHT